MRFSSFISPIFLITILDLSTAIIIIISELIINTIIGFFSANNIFTNHVKNKQTFLEIYFNIINDLPKFLLGILTTMIVINLFMYNNPIKPLNIYLEITKGILTLKNHPPSINKFIILQTLVTSTGLAIILQNYWLTKKTKLSFNNYILYRLYAIVLSIIVSLIIYLYFNFNASLTIWGTNFDTSPLNLAISLTLLDDKNEYSWELIINIVSIVSSKHLLIVASCNS